MGFYSAIFAFRSAIKNVTNVMEIKMKFNKLYLITLLLPLAANGITTKGTKYIDGSGPVNPEGIVCANASTPLPIVISTLRDFGLTSIYKNRVKVTLEVVFWTEKERGIPLKLANFFSDRQIDWGGTPALVKRYQVAGFLKFR